MNNAKKLTSLALAISLSLGGGLALAVDHAGHSEDESSSATQAVSDTWITTQVKAELATADGVSSTDISVTTVDGVVTLTGVLPTRAADVNDVFWNAVGALLGALLAHLHASVRVEWA